MAARWLMSPWVREFESGQCSDLDFAAGLVAEWDLPYSAEEFLATIFPTWLDDPFDGAEQMVREHQRAPSSVGCLNNTNSLQWREDDLALAAARRLLRAPLPVLRTRCGQTRRSDLRARDRTLLARSARATCYSSTTIRCNVEGAHALRSARRAGRGRRPQARAVPRVATAVARLIALNGAQALAETSPSTVARPRALQAMKAAWNGSLSFSDRALGTRDAAGTRSGCCAMCRIRREDREQAWPPATIVRAARVAVDHQAKAARGASATPAQVQTSASGATNVGMVRRDDPPVHVRLDEVRSRPASTKERTAPGTPARHRQPQTSSCLQPPPAWDRHHRRRRTTPAWKDSPFEESGCPRRRRRRLTSSSATHRQSAIRAFSSPKRTSRRVEHLGVGPRRSPSLPRHRMPREAGFGILTLTGHLSWSLIGRRNGS